MTARRAVDVVIAAAVGAWSWFFLRAMWSPGDAVVVGLGVAAAVVWRRPRFCLVVGMATLLVARLVGVPAVGPAASWGLAVALVVSVSLGAFERPRVAAGGVLLLALTVSFVAPPASGFPRVGDVLWVAGFLGGPALLAGIFARARRRTRAERARVAALAARSPEEVARHAVADERERLLADVYAVLGEAVSSMLAHADSAGHAATAESATRHLREVQQFGREAVTELRVLLGRLRSPAESPPPSQDAEAKGSHRWRRWSDRVDSWLTLGVVMLAFGDLWIWKDTFLTAMPESNLLSTIVTIAAVATIALRRTYPLWGAISLGAFLGACGLLGAPVALGYAVLLTILTLTWSAMARPGIRPILSVAVLLGGATVYGIGQDQLVSLLVAPAVVTAVVSAATAHHRVRADISAAQAAGLDRDRRAASAEAVRAQRLTVARDLHDVVSHAVVVMTLQAGAAETLLPTDPSAARAALDRLRAVGSATLTELDDLFAALRAMDDTGSGDPVCHDIPALVARMRAGGLTVDLQAPPHQPSGPLVYRVVQESLTNSLRHAPRATVHVTITESEHGTTVEVVDDGPGPTSPAATRGYGLVGITERVEHAGGRVDTGPAPNGRGFRVIAHIPTSRAQVST